VELAGDLLGRAAVLEKAQDLGLPGSQMGVGRRRRVVLFDIQCLPEDADPPARRSRADRADLDG